MGKKSFIFWKPAGRLLIILVWLKLMGIRSRVFFITTGSIIGAGSELTKNVVPNKVVAGNPAKTIKTLL